MADTVAEPKETTTVEESVTSSVKESPVKKDAAETNGTSEPAENGNGTEAVEGKEEIAENGDVAEENGTKENGDVTDISAMDNAALIALLQEWGAIARSVRCQKCGCDKHLLPDASALDDFVWACKNPGHKIKKKKVGCYQRQSIRTNTFFEKSRLTLSTILIFVRLWVTYAEIQTIMTDANISSHTASEWNSFCREVAIHFCFNGGRPIGGPGKTVEIGESKFGRRNNHRGRAVEGQWVFGGVERESGDFFLVPVEQRDAATLTPLIQTWILPGTTVISDCWRSDNNLQNLDYAHLTVNHSVNFVDPETGAHTNQIEGLWRHAKHRMPHYRRVKDFFLGYLAKFMFLNKVQRENLDPTVEFMRAAAGLYSLNGSTPQSVPLAVRERTDTDTDSGSDSE